MELSNVLECNVDMSRIRVYQDLSVDIQWNSFTTETCQWRRIPTKQGTSHRFRPIYILDYFVLCETKIRLRCVPTDVSEMVYRTSSPFLESYVEELEPGFLVSK